MACCVLLFGSQSSSKQLELEFFVVGCVLVACELFPSA